MSNQIDALSTEQIVIHLMHGTGAENAPWTQPGSYFRERLVSRLRDLGNRSQIKFNAPHWGGQNRQSTRLAGADKLREQVRENRSREGGRTRQLLIGHSHGGTVSFLACKEPNSIADDLIGMICLSTPFPVFRRASNVEWLFAACTVAWAMFAIYGGLILTDGSFAVGMLLGITVFALFGLGLLSQLRGYNDPEVLTVPDSLPFPVHLFRCPGDEASAVLGASLITERVMVLLTSKAASVWTWVFRPIRYILLSIVLVVTVVGLMVLSVSLTGSLEPLKWPAIILAALIAVVLVVPLLLYFPLRFILYWSSYGFDVAFRGLFLDVTAEATPPGAWLVHTFFRKQSDSTPSISQAHSELHENEQAIDVIAEWISGLVGSQPEHHIARDHPPSP